MKKGLRLGFLVIMALALSTTTVMANSNEWATDLANDYVKGPGAKKLALGTNEQLVLQSSYDDGTGTVHVRYRYNWKNVRLWGEEAIVHVDLREGKVTRVTNNHRRVAKGGGQINLFEDQAIDSALRMMNVSHDAKTTAELVHYPVANGYCLAWVIDIFAENENEDPQAAVYVFNAETGAMIDRWDNLQYYTPGTGTAKTGTSKPLYLAASPSTWPINTEQYTDLKFGMVDRLAGNSYTTDMLNKKTGTGTLFSDADNIWGNYLASDRATAGVDAHLGMTLTYNYFYNIHGRNGIFNDGKGVYSRVHYGRSYNNAFWSASCKCMTYGDGDGTTFTPLVSLDVAAHEMSHGVCAATCNLVYSGESGGLNESNSDIFGTAVEFYANSTKDTPDWLIGEMIYTPAIAGDALRYMDDPKKDGRSIDHYSLYTSTLDVHYSSGLANNWFYLLAQGGVNKTSGIAVSGIGISKAERIWYIALTGYMTSTTTFSQARTATVNAATQLYGATSIEVQRVKDAWSACGVY